MRTLFTFVALVSVVLVPWSSLAPALLPDASGSAISSGMPQAPALAARLCPALGLLPLSVPDEPEQDDAEPVSTTTDSAADPQAPRMICENGRCWLVNEPSHLTANKLSRASVQLESPREKLEKIGATQISTELNSDGQWRCACSVPVRAGSPVMRRFEVQGSSDEQAIQEACRQVEAWLQDRR